jgi:sulfur carrier protein ThiS
MTVKLNLAVNDTIIHTDYFVEGFIDHVLSGIIEALEGTSKIKDLDLSIDERQIVINLNGDKVPLNAFTAKIIKNTIIGMVSSLKEVNNIQKLGIFLHK